MNTELPDLFWEPAIDSLVRLRPAAKTGVKPFDEYPLLVRRRHEVSGMVLFACETTGPMEKHTTRAGRVYHRHPSWTSHFEASELLPCHGAQH